MSLPRRNGSNEWVEYSKLVISELERLDNNISDINNDIQQIKKQITTLEIQRSEVAELKLWKASIDEIVSATQLKEKLEHLENLRTFRTTAITVFTIIQGIIAALFAVALRLI